MHRKYVIPSKYELLIFEKGQDVCFLIVSVVVTV